MAAEHVTSHQRSRKGKRWVSPRSASPQSRSLSRGFELELPGTEAANALSLQSRIEQWPAQFEARTRTGGRVLIMHLDPAEDVASRYAPAPDDPDHRERVDARNTPVVYTRAELLRSPGRAYMKWGSGAAGVLTFAAFVLTHTVGAAAGFIALWLGGTVYFFSNFATARLGYPSNTYGAAAAAYATLACMMLAITAAVAAIFD